MAGQQSIQKYDKDYLYNKHHKSLMKQVDLWYTEDKFAIKTEYCEDRTLHDYLISEVYKDKNCEVTDFLNKKLRGALGDENIDIVDLRSMQIKYRDINNYYYTSPTWSEDAW